MYIHLLMLLVQGWIWARDLVYPFEVLARGIASSQMPESQRRCKSYEKDTGTQVIFSTRRWQTPNIARRLLPPSVDFVVGLASPSAGTSCRATSSTLTVLTELHPDRVTVARHARHRRSSPALTWSAV